MIKDAQSLLNRYIEIDLTKLNYIIDENQFAIDDAGIGNQSVRDVLTKHCFYPYVTKVINNEIACCYIGIIPFRIKVDYILNIVSVDPTSHVGRLLLGRPHKNVDYLRVCGQYHVAFSHENRTTYLICYHPTNPYGKKYIVTYNKNILDFIDDDTGFLEALKRLQTNRS